MRLAVVLSLVDQLTAPLRGAQERVAGFTRGLAALGRNLGLVAGLFDQATDAGPLSYLTSAIDVEHRLAALGNTADLSAAQLASIDRRLSGAARATNQFKADLLSANEVLIGAGVAWGAALDLTPVIGKTATATQAVIVDLAKVAESARTNMRVPVAEMQRAMDRLTVAGQSGKFELKDMARFLPSLTASLATLKLTGLENVGRLGAALQIAFRGAGEPSEAANNLLNFLNKLAAPETLRNFKKRGVDLERVLRTTRERGLDPFVEVLKQIDQATGGNEFKLGELFGDQQVLAFVKPMLQYMRDYQDIVAQVGRSEGQVAANFERMMGTTRERWKQFQIQMQTTDQPFLNTLLARLKAGLEWANAKPALAGQIALLATAATLAAPALLALSTPLGAVLAALAALGGAAAMALGLWNPIAEHWPEVWDTIVEEVGGRIARLVGALERFKAAMPTFDFAAPHRTTPAEEQRAADPSGLPAPVRFPALRQAVDGGWGGLAAALKDLVLRQPRPAPEGTLDVNTGSVRLGPAVQTLDQAAQTQRAAAEQARGAADTQERAAGISQQAAEGLGAAIGRFEAASAALTDRLANWHGTIGVQVTGPAQVTSVSSSTPAVTLEAGGAARGPALGAGAVP